MKHIASLHYITHPQSTYTVEQQVAAVCRGGCRWIQLRMKEALPSQRLAMATAIHPILTRYGAKLIINDDVFTAKAVGSDGVHLGKEDMHPDDARSMLGPDVIIGGTANSLDDVLRLGETDIDYIGLGPCRYTVTKKRLSPVLGHEGIITIIREARAAGIGLPIIAIGGILLDDIGPLSDGGVAGVAVSGAIHQHTDPVSASKAFVAQLITCH